MSLLLRYQAATPRSNAAHPTYITTTKGMFSYFAVMMWWNGDMGGFYEPYNTADARHETIDPAIEDAKLWAEQEGLEYRP